MTPHKANVASEPTSTTDVAEQSEHAKLADQVIVIVQDNADLFHEQKGDAYAVIPIDGRRAAVRLTSRMMKSWIAKTARTALGRSVGRAPIEEALLVLDGIARFECDARPVNLRVADHQGGICIDLGDDTGACVEVTGKGWVILETPPVMFRRSDAMRPLPKPTRGGSLKELRAFFNGANDDAHHLFAAWMVAALRPGRPFPILALHGEQGTAKSTASRVARSLVDPNILPVRSAPRTEDDLAVATVHSHVVAFDNLSGVPTWLSDSLCRLATGGGLSKRTLYANDEETIIAAIRPIIVNGIDDLANRADLAERCLVLELQPIAKANRMDERSFWRAFDLVAPQVFGVLLDGVASALKNLPSIQLSELPRMADFALWIAAAEPGLKLPSGTLLAAYERNRARVVDVALDASPVAIAVRALLDERSNRGRWEGTPDQCLAALAALVPEATRRSPGWPRSARALSSILRRGATFLRSVGVTLELDGHEGRGDYKHRVYKLSKVEGTTTVPTDPAPPTAENVSNSEQASPRPVNAASGPVRKRTTRHGAGSQTGLLAGRTNTSESGSRGRGDDGDDVAAASRVEGTAAGIEEEHQAIRVAPRPDRARQPPGVQRRAPSNEVPAGHPPSSTSPQALLFGSDNGQ